MEKKEETVVQTVGIGQLPLELLHEWMKHNRSMRNAVVLGRDAQQFDLKIQLTEYLIGQDLGIFLCDMLYIDRGPAAKKERSYAV